MEQCSASPDLNQVTNLQLAEYMARCTPSHAYNVEEAPYAQRIAGEAQVERVAISPDSCSVACPVVRTRAMEYARAQSHTVLYT